MIKCEFENGNKAYLRHVVVDALILDGQKFLMVKRAPHLLEGGKYALVGGFVERDETTKEAVIREVREESGYEVSSVEFLTFIDNPKRRNEDRQNIAFIYTAILGKRLAHRIMK